MTEAKRSKHIGVVGGGLLGMTLAMRLAEQGLKPTIIEGEEQTGGLVTPTQIGNYVWDKFYHVISPADLDVLSLLKEIGLIDQVRWRATKTGFFTGGRLYSMSNILEFLRFPPLNLIDKFRLGFTIFYASRIKSSNGLEGILVTDWLRKLSGDRTFHKIWLPLLRSKLGNYYTITSASFIWASISRMYKVRDTGAKKEMFGYVEGGYGTVLNRLQRHLDGIGVETISQSPAMKVTASNPKVEVELPGARTQQFDDIILTVPCSHIAALCPELSAIEKSRFGKIIYEGVICTSVISKDSLSGYYVTNITDDGIPLTGVIEMTAVVDKETFDENSLLYLPRYVAQDDPYWNKTDAEILDEFLGALKKMYPSFNKSKVVASKVVRAREVLPITTLNYSRELLPPTKTSLEHVFVVNSAQIANGTMNVNEIIGLANRKAKEIVEMIG